MAVILKEIRIQPSTNSTGMELWLKWSNERFHRVHIELLDAEGIAKALHQEVMLIVNDVKEGKL